MSKGKRYAAIADELVQNLKANGFVVQRYDAHSTASVYLKLDYGLAYSIRISDHPGKKHLRYTFNLLKGYKGKSLVKQDGVWRRYYNFEQIDKLLEDVLGRREWVKQMYHPDYEASMEKARFENQGKRGFWRDAVLV